MGTFSVEVEIGDPQGQRFEAAEALVDTGSSYTAFPESFLRGLGVQVLDRQEFLLADGRKMEHDLGQTWIRLDGRSRNTVVVFAPDGTQPIVGAVTLQEFSLAVDPMAHKLYRVPGYRLTRKELP